jgi:hypothetical protein
MIEHFSLTPTVHRCCGCPAAHAGPNRREFLGGSVLSGLALTGLAWAPLARASVDALPTPPPRRPLKVQPVLTYGIPTRHAQTSWRSWGGVQTESDLAAEQARIGRELETLKTGADHPLEFAPLVSLNDAHALEKSPALAGCDALLVYAAGGSIDGLQRLGKPCIVFLRHRSGPVSLWYEIVSPRFLRQHTDAQKVTGIEPGDVVIDRLDEVAWRLRALCGLVNTVGTRIVAIGGADAWAQPPGVVPDLVRRLWKLDIQELPYKELGPMIEAARKDTQAVALAQSRANAYLALPGTSLETEKSSVINAFLLEHVFRNIMTQAQCRAITVNACMGTIMPMSETTACLCLSTLNDDGYLAFCESDFVVIPAGMLAANITGHPMFLNDPTYPHDGVITLAHCTAPRKLDGKTPEPVRLLTHFESDYGASPKVEMKVGQAVTNIVPDFAGKRWLGFLGTITDAPFLPICRSQIDVAFTCDSDRVAERMPGFHWMTVYGDYRREVGYALRRIPIDWECLDAPKPVR